MSIAHLVIWTGVLAICYFAGAIWLRDEDKEYRARQAFAVAPTDLERRMSWFGLLLMLVPFGYYLFVPASPMALCLVVLQAVYMFERLAALWEQSVQLQDVAVEKCLKGGLIAVGVTFACFFLAAPSHSVIADIALALSFAFYVVFEFTLPDWAEVADKRRLYRR